MLAGQQSWTCFRYSQYLCHRTGSASVNQACCRNITDNGTRPCQAELEISESVLMQDIDGSIRILNKLKEMGIRVVMDNFGTGYSSLNYLRRLPVDTIKIASHLFRILPANLILL
ncbi:MAG: EAL domain-containing protein [Nitrosomonas sp.]|nr:EAL domain-containing protein [Nitrosomonas sp.]